MWHFESQEVPTAAGARGRGRESSRELRGLESPWAAATRGTSNGGGRRPQQQKRFRMEAAPAVGVDAAGGWREWGRGRHRREQHVGKCVLLSNDEYASLRDRAQRAKNDAIALRDRLASLQRSSRWLRHFVRRDILRCEGNMEDDLDDLQKDLKRLREQKQFIRNLYAHQLGELRHQLRLRRLLIRTFALKSIPFSFTGPMDVARFPYRKI